MIDYVSDQRRFRGTVVFTLSHAVFPMVNDLFPQAIPMNQCVWYADCEVHVDDPQGLRVYTWGSTCDSTDGHATAEEDRSDDGDWPDGSEAFRRGEGEEVENEALSSATPSRLGSQQDDESSLLNIQLSSYRGTAIHRSSQQERTLQLLTLPRDNTATLARNSELLEDINMMMQLPWQLAFDMEELINHELRDMLYAAHNTDVVYPPILQIDNRNSQGPDLLHTYLMANIDIGSRPFFTVYTWGIQHQVSLMARVGVMQNDRSYLVSLLRLWQDFEEKQPLFVTLAIPQPAPLTLRVLPVDLILLTNAQRINGERIFLVDVLFPTLPKRMAVVYQTGEILRDLVLKAGLGEVCINTRSRCVLTQVQDGVQSRWEYLQKIPQPHGSTFELIFEDVNTEETCYHQQALVQVPAKSEYEEEDSVSLMQASGDNTATPNGRIGLEQGRGRASIQGFLRACWLRSFWEPPLVFNPELVATAWIWRREDIVRGPFPQAGIPRGQTCTTRLVLHQQ